MANPSTLYRFQIDLSDIDRGVYESFDVRVAMHPSETEAYLLTRILAYALNFQSGIEFSQGLCVPDEPAIRVLGNHGGIGLWIEIGNPAPRRLHKASKAADQVRVYTYKDPGNILREAAGEAIHRASEIEIFSLEPKFLEALAARLARDNRWSILRDQGSLVVTIGDGSVVGNLTAHRLNS